MREKTLHLIAVLCYVCGAVFFGYTAYVCTYDALSMRGIVLLSTLVFLSFLLGTFLRCRVETAVSHPGNRWFSHGKQLYPHAYAVAVFSSIPKRRRRPVRFAVVRAA